MKFAIITDGITPFVLGGMQRHSYLLAKYLIKGGHQVDLVTQQSMKLESEQEVFELFQNPSPDQFNVHFLKWNDHDKLPGHYIRSSYKMSKQVLSLITPTDYDFVLCKGFTGWDLIDQKKNHPEWPPIAVKFHGMNMFQKQANLRGELDKYLFRKPVRRIMSKSDYVFSYGGRITDIIANQGIERSKIIELPSGVEESWLSDARSSKAGEGIDVLFVGRFDRVKGLPELYKCIQSNPDIKSKARFHFVGPIPTEHQLQLAGVNYYGAIRNEEELKKVYDSCDVLICPSVSEGMPNVILEAMSRGLAIIATDVGAIHELVDEMNGILLTDNNPEGLTIALRVMMDKSTNELMEMGEIGRKRILDRFTWPRLTQRFLEITKELSNRVG